MSDELKPCRRGHEVRIRRYRAMNDTLYYGVWCPECGEESAFLSVSPERASECWNEGIYSLPLESENER